jgi:UPF0716 protein FxsA
VLVLGEFEFFPTALPCCRYDYIGESAIWFQGLEFCQPNRAFVCSKLRLSGPARQHDVPGDCGAAKMALQSHRIMIEGFGPMRPIKLIAIGLLAWPALELLAFICVSAAIGFTNALFLILLMSVVGLLLLRHFGGYVRRFRATTGGAGIAAATFGGAGMAPGLGGILLLIPGFVTSVFGVVILFPVPRRWLLAGCRRALAAGQRPADRNTIDLAPNEWHPLPGSKLPPAGRSQ